MKYIRVVLAVQDDAEEILRLELDEFIEGPFHHGMGNIQGAYVSGGYEYVDEALHGEWKETS